MPRGRPCETEGSPRTRARREKDKLRKQQQRERANLGVSKPVGRPRKASGPCPQTLSTAASREGAQGDEAAASNSRGGQHAPAMPPAAVTLGPPQGVKPTIPDGDPNSPRSPPALPTSGSEAAPVLDVPKQLDAKGLCPGKCLVCLNAETDAQQAKYLPCCAHRVHVRCLASWRTSAVLKSGQQCPAAKTCPACRTPLHGTRDLRDAAPTAAEQRAFMFSRNAVRHRQLVF